MLEPVTNVAKDLLSPVLDPVLSLAQEVLPLVEDVTTAVLPETQAIFEAASSLFGKGSTAHSAPGPSVKHPALGMIQKLSSKEGHEKQSLMVRVLELLLDEVESL